MELWQFKYEEKYDLTYVKYLIIALKNMSMSDNFTSLLLYKTSQKHVSSEQKDMHKLELAQESSRQWTKDGNTESSKSTDPSSDTEPVHSPDPITLSPESPATPPEHTLSPATYHMTGTFVRRMTSIDQIPGQNKFMANKFLDKLPWCDLPLAESLSMHPMDKWEQCKEIYLKFIQDSSYYAINIGYDATNEINAKYEQLWQYKRNSNSKTAKDLTTAMTKANDTTITAFDGDNNNGNVEIEMPNEISVPDISIDDDVIVNDEQFNSVMMELFDVAMKDILKNLSNSLNRFITTDTFKMLNQ